MSTDPERVAQALLDEYGRTYAEDAGIRLADRPAPLYQLLVLSNLLSARISADIAVRSARELFAAGYRTPAAMAAATWRDRVDALGRGGYRRYDESTATRLGDGAVLLLLRWHGDLRRLRHQAQRMPANTAALLMEFPGVGPAGASIFLREAQEVWPELSPHVDEVMSRGARRVGLSGDHNSLGELLTASGQPARLAAALVRTALSERAAEHVTERVAAAERVAAELTSPDQAVRGKR